MSQKQDIGVQIESTIQPNESKIMDKQEKDQLSIQNGNTMKLTESVIQQIKKDRQSQLKMPSQIIDTLAQQGLIIDGQTIKKSQILMQQLKEQNIRSQIMIQSQKIQVQIKEPQLQKQEVYTQFIKTQDETQTRPNRQGESQKIQKEHIQSSHQQNNHQDINQEISIKQTKLQQLLIIKKQLKLTKVYELNCSSLQNYTLANQNQNKSENIIEIRQNTQLSVSLQNKEEKIQKKQPLKVESLFISSFLSRTKSVQVKTPQTIGQRKLKPWQKMKKAPSVIINKQTQEQKTVPIPSLQEKSEVKAELKDQSQMNQKINDFFNVNLNKQQIVNKMLEDNQKKDQIPLQKVQQSPLLQSQKAQKIIISENKSLAQTTNKQFVKTQFHETKNDPLLRHINSQANSNQSSDKYAQFMRNNPSPLFKQSSYINIKQESQISQKSQASISLDKVQTNKMQGYMKQRVSQVDEEESQSQQQNKLYEQMNKKRLQMQEARKQRKIQLQMQLKRQKQINSQLQQSASLSFKLAASTIAGASISGLSWLLKKNKSNSIMFGLAATIATFIISN